MLVIGGEGHLLEQFHQLDGQLAVRAELAHRIDVDRVLVEVGDQFVGVVQALENGVHEASIAQIAKAHNASTRAVLRGEISRFTQQVLIGGRGAHQRRWLDTAIDERRVGGREQWRANLVGLLLLLLAEVGSGKTRNGRLLILQSGNVGRGETSTERPVTRR